MPVLQHWRATEVHLVQAFRLESADQIARLRLIEFLLVVLTLIAHHLPEAYLGDPKTDLETVQKAEDLKVPASISLSVVGGRAKTSGSSLASSSMIVRQ